MSRRLNINSVTDLELHGPDPGLAQAQSSTSFARSYTTSFGQTVRSSEANIGSGDSRRVFGGYVTNEQVMSKSIEKQIKRI